VLQKLSFVPPGRSALQVRGPPIHGEVLNASTDAARFSLSVKETNNLCQLRRRPGLQARTGRPRRWWRTTMLSDPGQDCPLFQCPVTPSGPPNRIRARPLAQDSASRILSMILMTSLAPSITSPMARSTSSGGRLARGLYTIARARCCSRLNCSKSIRFTCSSASAIRRVLASSGVYILFSALVRAFRSSGGSSATPLRTRHSANIEFPESDQDF